MWGSPHRASPLTLGCGAGRVGNKLFIVLSDYWHGGLFPHLGVCVCERDSGYLMPGALPPHTSGLRVPEFGLWGIASQTIFYRTCVVISLGKWGSALPSCPPHS